MKKGKISDIEIIESLKRSSRNNEADFAKIFPKQALYYYIFFNI